MTRFHRLFLPLLLLGSAQAATLQVRAWASLYQGQGPAVEVRVNGQVAGRFTVNSAQTASYSVVVPTLPAGAAIDLVFTNDAGGNGEDRNLFIESMSDGAGVVLLPLASACQIDRGVGAKAFDGLEVLPGQGAVYWNAALRCRWPQAVAEPSAAVNLANRFLLRASFGARPGEAEALAAGGNRFADWIDAQLRLQAGGEYVAAVQQVYAQGDAFRPGGASYSPNPLQQQFWKGVATSPDGLRKRVAWALHTQWMVSLTASDLYFHSRAYARYLDQLNQHALGNYRPLMEAMALSPVMGIYLSHIRNQKEDLATGRMPDENFARELMQLFSIGLHELNPDGSLKRDASGNPIETYTNADVMALAKVFTGYAWGFPDGELTNQNFRWGNPDLKAANDRQIDLQPMKAYPGQSSTAALTLFAGKPWRLDLPAGMPQGERLKRTLDTLFQHPNVGPFVARQLIQRLVSSNPSPAYVQRVAAVFANNGRGVRGDLGATVRALLLDPEALNGGLSVTGITSASATNGAKLREPVLRVAQWLRAFDARSPLGDYAIAWDLEQLGQPVFRAPSVFSYFRPGYLPAGTPLASRGQVAPELQIVNESTAAHWVNRAESMAGNGLGWSGNTQALKADYASLVPLLNSGNALALTQRLNQQLYAGRMSAVQQQRIAQAMGTVSGNDAAAQLNRVRLAVFLALASPDFQVQP